MSAVCIVVVVPLPMTGGPPSQGIDRNNGDDDNDDVSVVAMVCDVAIIEITTENYRPIQIMSDYFFRWHVSTHSIARCYGVRGGSGEVSIT